jgi:hypothetical protein
MNAYRLFVLGLVGGNGGGDAACFEKCNEPEDAWPALGRGLVFDVYLNWIEITRR